MMMSRKLVELADQADIELDMGYFPWKPINVQLIPMVSEGAVYAFKHKMFSYQRLGRTWNKVYGITFGKRFIAAHFRKTVWLINIPGIHINPGQLKYFIKGQPTQFGYSHKEIKQILTAQVTSASGSKAGQ